MQVALNLLQTRPSGKGKRGEEERAGRLRAEKKSRGLLEESREVRIFLMY